MTDTPEFRKGFEILIAEKRRLMLGVITAVVNTEQSVEERYRLADSFVPELIAPLGFGPGALHHADVEILLHLLAQLARERGESVEETWRREAAVLYDLP